MDNLGIICVASVIVFFVVITILWRTRRATGMVESWAQEEGLELLDYQRRSLFRGPFFFRTSENQEVYYVTVRDPQGRTRHAYLRCGSWIGGLWSNRITAEWED
jgi:hypothetical protein